MSLGEVLTNVMMSKHKLPIDKLGYIILIMCLLWCYRVYLVRTGTAYRHHGLSIRLSVASYDIVKTTVLSFSVTRGKNFAVLWCYQY